MGHAYMPICIYASLISSSFGVLYYNIITSLYIYNLFLHFYIFCLFIKSFLCLLCEANDGSICSTVPSSFSAPPTKPT